MHVEITTRSPSGEYVRYRGEASSYEEAKALAEAQIPEDHIRYNIRVQED